METNALILATIAGVFLPLVTGLLAKCSWAQWIKFLIVIICALVAGVGTLAVQGGLDGLTWQTLYSQLGSIYVASAVSFWWILPRIPGLKDWLYSHLIHD